MDFRTAVKDIRNMSFDEINSYYGNNDPSAGKMPDNEDDYYNPGKSTTTASELLKGAAEAGNGPDNPAAEPGEAPGATKNWTAEDFESQLGLSSRSDVGENFNEGAGATDSDKTKSNPLLGKGYLSDSDYERLKGDSTFQDLYMKEAGNFSGSKAERIESGDFDWDEMSINHMDAFLDKFGSKMEKPKEKPEYKKSERLAKAEARMSAYDEVVSGKQGDILFGKNPDYAQDFSNAYKKALSEDPNYQSKFDVNRDAKNLRFDS